MAKRTMNSKVDFFFDKAKQWKEEFEALRTIVLDCGLAEELKWGQPCYTFEKKNIVLIHGFKEYCAVLFFKGALLKDAKGVLIQQTQNVQAARQEVPTRAFSFPFESRRQPDVSARSEPSTDGQSGVISHGRGDPSAF